MVAPVPRRPPRLAATLSPAEDVALDGGADLRDLHVTGASGGDDASGLDVHGCRFTGVRLVGADLARSRITDTVFERCDLSAASVVDSSLLRTAFVDCRLGGTVLSGASLTDVAFDDCQLAGLELRMATSERLELSGCDLRGADFHASGLSGARLTGCDLSGADCSRAQWDGAWLHGSRLTDLRGAGSLAGVTIGSDQAVPLGLLLLGAVGITVDDEAG